MNVAEGTPPSSPVSSPEADGQSPESVRRKKIIRPAREKHPFVARCEYILFLGLFFLLRAVPFRVAFRLGALGGWLLYVCDRPHRRVGLLNLTIAFPDKTQAERRVILRESLLNLGRLVAEFCHLHTLTQETISERVSFADFAQWQELVTAAKETGALILTGHFGNWELFAYAHAHYGFPVHIIHRRLRNPLIDGVIVAERERCGNKVIHKTTAGLEVLRAIRKKALVVAAVDQNASGRMGVFVPFFSRLASTSSGLAGLALASGVPVIPAFLVRERGTWRHRIIVFPPVEPVRSGNQEADLRATTEKFSAVFQRMVEQYPEQWLWIHKRWKRRPEGEGEIY